MGIQLCPRTQSSYQALGIHNIGNVPEWHRMHATLREDIDVVARVLPFRTNRYVVESLIDWSRVPDDPVFQMVFPQRGMLAAEQYAAVQSLLRAGAAKQLLAATVRRIRLQLNPEPGGQLSHNIPKLDGRALPGLQHKYRETVLFFPQEGQTCHAYCTYCFRWAQFVDLEGYRIGNSGTSDLVEYLRAHREVTDVLFTGGDAMVMRTSRLRRYIEPLLAPGLEHVQNIRIGTKAVASWPQRFVSDGDADDCLRLFEEIIATGRHLAVMGHYAHPVELEPPIARAAIRRIRNTGAQIRMQAPLIRHVNDSADTWASLWRTGVRLGLIPYYMFVERDTGARNYFEVPLARAYEICRDAYASVSGLARTVQGPSMSAFPGKIRIMGTTTLREMMGERARELSGIRPDEQVFVCDFIQARDPALVRTLFFAEGDPEAAWFDQLRPAFGRPRFPFETRATPAYSVTECLLH